MFCVITSTCHIHTNAVLESVDFEFTVVSHLSCVVVCGSVYVGLGLSEFDLVLELDASSAHVPTRTT